jgi:hypothetical protein
MTEDPTAVPGTGAPSAISPSVSNPPVPGKQFWETDVWTAMESMGGLMRMCIYTFLALFGSLFLTPWGAPAMPSIFKSWIGIGAYHLTILKVPRPTVTYNTPVDRKSLKATILSLINDVDHQETILLFGNKGCGKSTLLQFIFEGVTGVVNLRIKTADDLKAFYPNMAIVMSIGESNNQQRDDEGALLAFKKKTGNCPVVN